MAGEPTIPDNVMNALIENTKVIDANTEVLTKLTGDKEKTTKKEENVVQKPVVNSSLTSDEKARYANIGKELFSPVITSLEKLLKKEKKRNEMSIKDDTQSMEDSIKVQYETKPNPEAEGKGTSWLTIILGILAVAGVAVALFHDKIGEFFSAAWDWIKDMFSSIGKFFSFDNKESPINKILDACGSALGGLWELVKKVFKKVGEFGSIIWNGIKAGWDKFITGPNGILNFGIKIVKGIIGFASNAISAIGSAIKEAVMGPIRMIFGGAKDDGKVAGEEAAQDVKASVNQASADQVAKTKAITDNVIFSAQKADQAIIETAKATREDAKKRAKEQGLTINNEGKVTEDSLKESAAKAGLEAFMKANNVKRSDVDDKKYNALMAEFKKHVQVNGNEAKINMENLRNALAEEANAQSNWIAPDGPFMNALETLNEEGGAEKMNQINGAVTGALQQGLQISADMQAAQNLENMTEEERFEARMRQAMAEGKSAEFRFTEGREMILKSTKTIKSAFGSYDEQIRANFTGTWTSFMTDFLDSLKIHIETVSPQDNSKNTYNITPLHKQSFGEMTNKMLKLAQENTAILVQQNKLLSNIQNLLLEPPAQKIIVESANPNKVMDKADEATNHVAQSIKRFGSELFDSISLWA